MKKHIILVALSMLFIGTATVHGQNNPSSSRELPNISVVGNLLGSNTDADKSFDVKEIELAIQHYLNPNTRADVFIAIHKDGDERVFELEEGYVTFTDVMDLILPEQELNWGISSIAGRKLIGAGKTNTLHFEQLRFVDRPIVVQQFLGGDEGLVGEGAQFSALLPLPFFSQLEVGYWKTSAHEDEEEEDSEEEESGIEFGEQIVNARLWNSFEMGNSSEFELGLSYLQGNASASAPSDKQDIFGVDMTYSIDADPQHPLIIQSEYFTARFGHEDEERATQSGATISAIYRLNKHYDTGIRYGYLTDHGDEDNESNQWSAILTRRIDDTSRLRLQYNTGDNVDNTVLLQYLFVMGPHKHALQ